MVFFVPRVRSAGINPIKWNIRECTYGNSLLTISINHFVCTEISPYLYQWRRGPLLSSRAQAISNACPSTRANSLSRRGAGRAERPVPSSPRDQGQHQDQDQDQEAPLQVHWSQQPRRRRSCRETRAPASAMRLRVTLQTRRMRCCTSSRVTITTQYCLLLSGVLFTASKHGNCPLAPELRAARLFLRCFH